MSEDQQGTQQDPGTVEVQGPESCQVTCAETWAAGLGRMTDPQGCQRSPHTPYSSAPVSVCSSLYPEDVRCPGCVGHWNILDIFDVPQQAFTTCVRSGTAVCQWVLEAGRRWGVCIKLKLGLVGFNKAQTGFFMLGHTRSCSLAAELCSTLQDMVRVQCLFQTYLTSEYLFINFYFKF